jgi:hypothetical protein
VGSDGEDPDGHIKANEFDVGGPNERSLQSNVQGKEIVGDGQKFQGISSFLL